MVKLYGLSVFYKNPSGTDAKLLKAAYDVSSFSYFQRSSVQDFIIFVGKTIVDRTTLATRQSVKQDVYMCHAYVKADGLSAVLVADHEYPQRVAHTLLTKVLDDFTAKVPKDVWPSGSESSIDFHQLPAYLTKYQDPREADALTKMQDDLDETKIILRNTLEAVLERGEKLDDLVQKSDQLTMQSKAFYKTAKKTNSCCKLL